MITFKSKEYPGTTILILEDSPAGVIVFHPTGISLVTSTDANNAFNSGEWFDFSDEIPALVMIAETIRRARQRRG